jgi:uncharacterized protein YxjI
MMEETIDQQFTTTTIPSKYEYPIEFEFKIGTLANDFIARNSSGETLAYVRQKMFKFKEAIQIFSDENRATLLYTINADRVIDFNANYFFADASGEQLGKVGRKGARSLFNAHYDIFDSNGEHDFVVREENPMAKFFDALLGQVPLVSLFSGYFLNPRYIVKRTDGTSVARLSKQASFWGRRFKLDKLSELSDKEAERLMLGLMMMSLLERSRG